jgi:hypothetical protein
LRRLAIRVTGLPLFIRAFFPPDFSPLRGEKTLAPLFLSVPASAVSGRFRLQIKV